MEWTVRKILDWTKDYFRKAGISNSRLTAEKLLAHSLDVDRLYLYLYPDRPINKEERAACKELIKKRKRGIPTQYLIGKVSFLGCELKVDTDVFIPRPETEEMVEKIISENRDDKALNVLDLGTGSGAIAIALARYLNISHLTALDISQKALNVAQDNAKRNKVQDRIKFLLSDWFSQVSESYDLIVSNPPYVSWEEMDRLPDEVKENEPLKSLNGGRKGLEEIKKLINSSSDHLKDSGELWMEIGHNHSEDVMDIIANSSLNKREVKFIRDLNGKCRILRVRPA